MFSNLAGWFTGYKLTNGKNLIETVEELIERDTAVIAGQVAQVEFDALAKAMRTAIVQLTARVESLEAWIVTNAKTPVSPGSDDAAVNELTDTVKAADNALPIVTLTK
jgi:hypothetical protein